MKRFLLSILLNTACMGCLIAQKVPEHSTWKINASIYGGFSSRLVVTPTEISLVSNKYLDRIIANGHHYGIDLDYVLSSSDPGRTYKSVGIKCETFASNSFSNVTLIKSDGTSENGKLTNNISQIYIAPTVQVRFKRYLQKNYFIINFSFGHFEYSDEAKFNSEEISIKANTVAVMIDLGYEVGINKHLAAIATISLFGDFSGAVHYTRDNVTEKINFDYGDGLFEKKQDTGGVNISLGVRIR